MAAPEERLPSLDKVLNHFLMCIFLWQNTLANLDELPAAVPTRPHRFFFSLKKKNIYYFWEGQMPKWAGLAIMLELGVHIGGGRTTSKEAMCLPDID